MPSKDIEIKDLWFRYEEGDWVLKGIDLEVEEGEFIAIMGENGAGKTTLVKHLNGLLKPLKGYVKIKGTDTRTVSVAELAKYVGLVFQNPDHQIFAETVEEEVAFALRNFGFPPGEIQRRVEEVLREMGLSKYKGRSPFLLSGGEKKRLALASVLVYDPDIIVLDEPTTGQDYKQKAVLGKIIKQMNAKGKTVIVVTHDVEFVVDLFDEVVIMARGRILARGRTEDILTNEELVKKARLVMPQLAEAAMYLEDNIRFKGNYLREDNFVKCIISALGEDVLGELNAGSARL